jgi:hypothetical protein
MPVTKFSHPDPYTYQTGFDSYHEYAPHVAPRNFGNIFLTAG